MSPAAISQSKWNGLKRTPFVRKVKAVDPAWKIGGLPWPASWQSEADFQKAVEELAAYTGWASSHAHLPFFDTAGIPDLLLVHKETGRTIFAELKATAKTGRVPKPSPAQQRWLNWLGIRNEVFLWTWPQSWGEIERELKDSWGKEAAARIGRQLLSVVSSHERGSNVQEA